MVLQKQPWNKGKGDTLEIKKEKRKAYYAANRDIIIKKVAANREAKSIQYKEYMRWYFIEKKYGLTKMQYLDLLTQQAGKCAICIKRPARVVDHDHSTGKVRGLLCHGCNRDLAILDNPSLLIAAQRYKNESQ